VILGTLAALAMLSQPSPGPDSCARLEAVVKRDRLQEILNAVVNAPPDCSGHLTRLLEAPGEVSFSAARALSYLGSSEGQDALYRSLSQYPHWRTAVHAAVGAGAVRRPRDIDFLCGEVRADRGDGGRARKAAALSLGLLGSDRCKDALTTAANESWAARYALEQIDRHHPCRSSSGREKWERAFRAVLECGMADSKRAPAYYLPSANQVWLPGASGWTVRPAAIGENETLPRVFCVPRFSRRGDSAIISVTWQFGALDAQGYDFLVQADGEEWVVMSIEPTWVS
jgi:hypothetical protein